MQKTIAILWLPLFLFGGSALFLWSCSEGESPTKEDAAGTARGDSFEREKKAKALFAKAAESIPREKVSVLRRLIALYSDTETAKKAHLTLCFYLQDHAVARYDEAWLAVKTFRDRHPTDAGVSECFKWMANNAARGIEGWTGPDMGEVLTTWAAYLDDVLPRVTEEQGDLRAILLRERAEVSARQGDPAAARAHLEAAAKAACADPNRRLEILWSLACFLAEDESAKDARREYLEEVLTLKRGGARGHPEEVILAALEETR